MGRKLKIEDTCLFHNPKARNPNTVEGRTAKFFPTYPDRTSEIKARKSSDAVALITHEPTLFKRDMKDIASLRNLELTSVASNSVTRAIYRAEGDALSPEKSHSFRGHSQVSIFCEQSTSAR